MTDDDTLRTRIAKVLREFLDDLAMSDDDEFELLDDVCWSRTADSHYCRRPQNHLTAHRCVCGNAWSYE